MIFLVRHAESEANAGGKTTLLGTHITANGKIQSQKLAELLTFVPDLVVTTKYSRTIETANPTLTRFPLCEREEWNLHEYTYLSNPNDIPSTAAERKTRVDEYWKRADPYYIDGPDVESFHMFMTRVQESIDKLYELKDKNILIFTHGLVIKAYLWMRANNKLKCSTWTSEDMNNYHKYTEITEIKNLLMVKVE